MSSIADRIMLAYRNSRLTYQELETRTGISKSPLQRYITGETGKIPIDRLESIARALNVSAAYLMGWEDPPLPENITPMPEMKKIPLIGSIACGTPILAEENIEQYVNWKSEAATLDIQGYPAFSPTLLWRLVPSKSRSPFRHKGQN